MTAHEPEQISFAVIDFVLAIDPQQLTIAELVRELADDPEKTDERDAIETAIRDLVGSGLLQRHGPFVLPTRSARRCWQLADLR